MKKFVSCWSKIYVHPITSIVFFLALISGRLKPLMTFTLITLVHELGHILMALILRVKVEHITILPFGMFAKMENMENIPIYKELLIVIAGPIMYIPTLFILNLLYRHGGLSFVAYQQSLGMALTLLLFNLIPLYPLDGGRVIHLLSIFILPVKKSYYCIVLISIVTAVTFTIININNPPFVLLGYLFFLQIEFFLSIHRRWIHFLLMRKEKKRKIKVHRQHDIYRPYHNFIISSKGIIDESQLITYLLAKKQSKTK